MTPDDRKRGVADHVVRASYALIVLILLGFCAAVLHKLMGAASR